MKLDQFDSVEGDWTITHGGERVESRIPGSRLKFKLRAAEPALPFLQRKDGGAVLVSASGFETAIDLRSDGYGFRQVRIPSQAFRTVSFVGTLATADEIVVQSPDKANGGALLFNLGGGRLLKKAELRPGESYKLQLTPSIKAKAVATLAIRFWATLGLAALIIAFLAISGMALLRLARQPGVCVSPTIAVATGFCTLALFINTLSYFFPVRKMALPLSAFLCLMAGYGVYLLLNQKTRMPVAETYASGNGIIAGFSGIWISFFPVSIAGMAYLGFLQTDSFFYTTVSNSLQDDSLQGYLSKGGLIGHGLRSIDLSLSAALASISHLPTAEIWLALCVVFMFLPPVVAYEFVLEWRKDRRAAAITAWAVAMSAPLASLFFEAYLAQYLLTGLLYLNLFCGWRLYESVASRSFNYGVALPFVVSTAVAILLYPYFAALTFVIAAAILLRLLRDGQVKTAISCMVGVLASANVGLYFLFNHQATASFTPRLNEIAKYVVFPFYNGLKFPSFILGLSPIHGSKELFAQVAIEFDKSPLYRIVAKHVRISEGVFPIAVIGLLAGIYIYALQRDRKSNLSGFGLVLPVSAIGYVVLMGVALRFSGLYSFCKLAWTVGALLPIVLVPTLVSFARSAAAADRPEHYLRTIKAAAVTVLSAFLVGNTLSKTSASMLWMSNPYGIAMSRVNTAVAGELADIQESLQPRESIKTGTFAFYEQSTLGRGSQKSQVLAAHVYSFMRSQGYQCLNCVVDGTLLDFRGYTAMEKSRLDEASILVRFDRELE